MEYIMPLKQKKLIVEMCFENAGGIYFEPIDADILLQFYYIITMDEGTYVPDEMDVLEFLDKKYLEGFEFPDDYEVVKRMFDMQLQDRIANKYSLESVMDRLSQFSEEKMEATVAKINELEKNKSETLGKLEQII